VKIALPRCCVILNLKLKEKPLFVVTLTPPRNRLTSFLTYHTAWRLVRRLFSLEHKTAEEMRRRVAINLLRGFCFRDFEQSHPSCFTPGEVESLRCEITVRCVGAGVCGFDGDVQ
jgi:hypothetical protein